MASFTELALKVAAAKQAGDDLVLGEAAQAWAELGRLAAKIALSVHFARSQLLMQAARDFSEHGASDHIYTKILKFRTWYQANCAGTTQETTDPFIPWCRTVLDNKYTDLVRKQGRENARRKEVDFARQAATTSEPWERLDELSSDDLARLESLDPLDVVILMVLTGKWTTLPPQFWLSLLARVGQEPTFPPESVRKAGKHREREALAEALGMNRNALDQRLSRLRRRLRARSES